MFFAYILLFVTVISTILILHNAHRAKPLVFEQVASDQLIMEEQEDEPILVESGIEKFSALKAPKREMGDYVFVPELNAFTPLKYLRLAGEHVDTLTQLEKDVPTEFGRWILKEENAVLIDDCLLSLLMQCRGIVERPLDAENNLAQASERIPQLKKVLKESHLSFDEFVGSEGDAFEIILTAHNLVPYLKPLSAPQILDLVELGYRSIGMLSMAEDKVFLPFKGIGPKRLEQLRRNMDDFVGIEVSV